MRPIGVFRDYDKPVEELTNEGKYFASDSTTHLSKIDLIQLKCFRESRFQRFG